MDFFLKEWNKISHRSVPQLEHKNRSTKPVVPQNLLLRRDVHTCAGVWTPLKKGQCESPCTARQDAAPSSLDPVLHVSALALAKHSRIWQSQLTNDHQFLRPARQAALGLPPQFRVCGLLRTPCLFRQVCLVVPSLRASWWHLRRVTPSQCRWPIGRLGTKSTIRDDFDSPSIKPSELGPKSRMKAFVVTLAPASPHTCAAAHSRG